MESALYLHAVDIKTYIVSIHDAGQVHPGVGENGSGLKPHGDVRAILKPESDLSVAHQAKVIEIVPIHEILFFGHIY